jgi:hypothetical protein
MSVSSDYHFDDLGAPPEEKKEETKAEEKPKE